MGQQDAGGDEADRGLVRDLTAPTIQTPRLVLRGHRPDDLEACAAMWADPEVVRHTIGTPARREETWWRLLRYAGWWAWGGYGLWAAEDRATGAFLGDVGFADFRRDLPQTPHYPEDGAPEAAWVFAPAAQGRGLATEAVGAAIGWMERQRGPEPLRAIVAPQNAASLRVAAKLGFVVVAQVEYHAKPTLLLRRQTDVRGVA